MFFVLSCVCYVFVRVCLYVLCGHLLGKGWPLGSRLWWLLWVCHFPIGILGQMWYLIVSIPDLCTLTYFVGDPFNTWASTRENLFGEFANNNGADQRAHPRRLISAFVIGISERIISKLATMYERNFNCAVLIHFQILILCVLRSPWRKENIIYLSARCS